MAHTAVRSDGLVDAVFEATVCADQHGGLFARCVNGVGGGRRWRGCGLGQGGVAKATRAAELGMEAPATPAQRGVINATLESQQRPTIGDDRGEEQGVRR